MDEILISAEGAQFHALIYRSLGDRSCPLVYSLDQCQLSAVRYRLRSVRHRWRWHSQLRRCQHHVLPRRLTYACNPYLCQRRSRYGWCWRHPEHQTRSPCWSSAPQLVILVEIVFSSMVLHEQEMSPCSSAFWRRGYSICPGRRHLENHLMGLFPKQTVV